MLNSSTTTANTFGRLWCKKCNDWKRHDSAGDCTACGRRLILKETPTVDMMAALAAKGYSAEQPVRE